MDASSTQPSLETIAALAKRRGFVFPTSEIYGGLANSYDYGPLGAEVLKNIRDAWWRDFVQRREEPTRWSRTRSRTDATGRII
jgi:glycyl-tRNA synthetase